MNEPGIFKESTSIKAIIITNMQNELLPMKNFTIYYAFHKIVSDINLLMQIDILLRLRSNLNNKCRWSCGRPTAELLLSYLMKKCFYIFSKSSI